MRGISPLCYKEDLEHHPLLIGNSLINQIAHIIVALVVIPWVMEFAAFFLLSRGFKVYPGFFYVDASTFLFSKATGDSRCRE